MKSLRPMDYKEKPSDFPEKTLRTLFFVETSWKNIQTQDVIIKTLETSSRTGAVELFQKENNYLNNTANWLI